MQELEEERRRGENTKGRKILRKGEMDKGGEKEAGKNKGGVMGREGRDREDEEACWEERRNNVKR